MKEREESVNLEAELRDTFERLNPSKVHIIPRLMEKCDEAGIRKWLDPLKAILGPASTAAGSVTASATEDSKNVAGGAVSGL